MKQNIVRFELIKPSKIAGISYKPGFVLIIKNIPDKWENDACNKGILSLGSDGMKVEEHPDFKRGSWKNSVFMFTTATVKRWARQKGVELWGIEPTITKGKQPIKIFF